MLFEKNKTDNNTTEKNFTALISLFPFVLLFVFCQVPRMGTAPRRGGRRLNDLLPCVREVEQGVFIHNPVSSFCSYGVFSKMNLMIQLLEFFCNRKFRIPAGHRPCHRLRRRHLVWFKRLLYQDKRRLPAPQGGRNAGGQEICGIPGVK
jgi:hypothetical protein